MAHICLLLASENIAAFFRDRWGKTSCSGFGEEGLPPVTTEGDEVGVFEFVQTVQASRQGKEYKSKIS